MRASLMSGLLGGVCLLVAAAADQPDLVDLRRFVPSLRFEIRYATTNNFTGRQLYPDARCFLRRAVAEQLEDAQRELQAQGLGLKVFDAFRPRAVQQTMWSMVPDPRYVADPAKGSRHNRGAAVDVTLVTAAGDRVPMPTEFDDFTERAHRDFADLPDEVIRNRDLLDAVMSRHGFVGLPSEWWHFDATNWAAFPILEAAPPPPLERHTVPREHPRLLGSRTELQALARERPAAYARMKQVAQKDSGDPWALTLSQALVAAIEPDATLAGKVRGRAMAIVDGPIRRGHVPFATDLALCALAFDLCHEAWSAADQARFHEYVNRTVDANRDSETHVFHNGWYGYKQWGIGLAAYASYDENPRAPQILAALEQDYNERAAPALELAGTGGGWAEGYYIHYWLYEWLFFCEVARRCEGIDYYAGAPGCFGQRALASAFEMFPGLSDYGSRRPIPMGDGGGRVFGGDRDKALAARRILVNHFRDDPGHQALHAFNETTPRSSVGDYAYKDFLWRDPTVPARPLTSLPLAHLSVGAGHVYARSSWAEDATHFFFQCGDRFTAHQHLDAGHFMIFKGDELAGDGGHYDAFGSPHDINYHLRSIAHSTILVEDPEERWPAIRAGNVTSNDGGQHHNWRHHNGAAADVVDWESQRRDLDTADLLAFADRGDHLYVAADLTRAYAPAKLREFTRRIVFVRPDTFVILDRVESTRPALRKTWVLQAMKTPERRGEHLVITHGKGRLFVQTLEPKPAAVHLAFGEDLYQIGNESYPPSRNTGPAPECRIEVSPGVARLQDSFLHVLTATDPDTESVPVADVTWEDPDVIVRTDTWEIRFTPADVEFARQPGEPTIP